MYVPKFTQVKLFTLQSEKEKILLSVMAESYKNHVAKNESFEKLSELFRMSC